MPSKFFLLAEEQEMPLAVTPFSDVVECLHPRELSWNLIRWEKDYGSLLCFCPGGVFIILIRAKKCYPVNSRFVILLFQLIELDSVCKLKIVSLVLFY